VVTHVEVTILDGISKSELLIPAQTESLLPNIERLALHLVGVTLFLLLEELELLRIQVAPQVMRHWLYIELISC
jgi:hypothetical protein